MFPRGILFFIVIMLIDMFLKKPQEQKKQSQEKPRRNIQDPNYVAPAKSQKENIPEKKKDVKDVNKKKPSYEKGRLSRKKDLYKDEPFYMKESIGSIDSIDSIQKRKTGNKEYSNEKAREDLLKGIIFSQILSEPKSIQNRKKSI